MKKDESLFIFGRLVPMEIVKHFREDEEAWGHYCDREHIIRLDSELEGEELMATILHEFGHALFKRLGWNQGINAEMEEAIAECYAIALVENFEIKLK